MLEEHKIIKMMVNGVIFRLLFTVSMTVVAIRRSDGKWITCKKFMAVYAPHYLTFICRNRRHPIQNLSLYVQSLSRYRKPKLPHTK